jgi:sugar transferase (PEP-CTERM/EpsH1 system associated)
MSRPIRILHVLHTFSAGGLENGVVNIVNGSPEHLEHELCFLLHAGDFLRRIDRPVVYHELNRRRGNDYRLIFKLAALFRERHVDIVHTRNWAAFDGFLAAFLTPGITLLHGEHGRDMSDPYGLNRRRNIMRRLMSFRARKFVAVSADLCRWLTKTVGIPKSKIVHIPNGVDLNRFRPARNRELRTKLGIGGNEFVVGTIGRLDPVKNHEGLIRAINQLNLGSAKVRLVIVGDGPNRHRLEQLIEEGHSRTSTMLPGYSQQPESFYGIFDLFVLNSFAEGMSNTILEAMSSGLPIICTPVGSNGDLVADGVHGMHVPVGNDRQLAHKIEFYRRDPALVAKHGSMARQAVEQDYSLPLMRDRYYDLYQSVTKISNILMTLFDASST